MTQDGPPCSKCGGIGGSDWPCTHCEGTGLEPEGAPWVKTAEDDAEDLRRFWLCVEDLLKWSPRQD